MVTRWKAPLVNDFFAMIFFGLLQKQCAKLVPEDANLHNRLLAGVAKRNHHSAHAGTAKDCSCHF